MERSGVTIVDTFAEAFGMKAVRLIITAIDAVWAGHAAQTMTGFATSVIGCGAEAGIERELGPHETPDGRPGVAVLVFALSGEEMQKQIERRVGQCVLTCPTTAVYSGLDGEKRIALGERLRYFGDGFQISKIVDGQRYWRIPVMDGEFVCEQDTARHDAVGGGNFLVLARDLRSALDACSDAVAAMAVLPGVITPFPGGIVRSGSKVGSKYAALMASTNDAYCPTLRGLTSTELGPDVGAVLEIVIDGLTEAEVAAAMRAGIEAVCACGSDRGIVSVTAGNYGGKLGQFHFHLHQIMNDAPGSEAEGA
ncbi:MAG: formylmethanofuran--tetrahydromethanopterin N-formyltransferase [Gammaproteobacteria bacterium]